jgi:hypothetical protein
VKQVEAGLYRRRRASDAVRLEVAADLDPRIRDLLVRELRLERDELYEAPGLLDLGALFELYERAPSEHKDAPWTPAEVFRGGRGAGDRAARRCSARCASATFSCTIPTRAFESSGRSVPHHRRRGSRGARDHDHALPHRRLGEQHRAGAPGARPRAASRSSCSSS